MNQIMGKQKDEEINLKTEKKEKAPKKKSKKNKKSKGIIKNINHDSGFSNNRRKYFRNITIWTI